MVTDGCKLYTRCLYTKTWTCHDLVIHANFTSFKG